MQQLHQTHPELARKLSLSHVLNGLTFGETGQHSLIRKRFGHNEHTSFDMMELVDDELYARDAEVKDYFYFFKLVPHVFVDQIHSEEFKSYSYSLNHNAKVKSTVQVKGSASGGSPGYYNDLRLRTSEHEDHKVTERPVALPHKRKEFKGV